MHTDDQLRRVWENRQKRSRRRALPQHVGEVARQLGDRKAWADTSWESGLREALHEADLEGIIECVTPLGIREGVLMLGVETASAASYLRVAWSGRLLDLFQARLPHAGINAIRFVLHKEA